MRSGMEKFDIGLLPSTAGKNLENLSVESFLWFDFILQLRAFAGTDY